MQSCLGRKVNTHPSPVPIADYYLREMKVFKFGGASVASVERIKKLPNILNQYSNEKILIVISAMGKTTNALETVVENFTAGKQDDALSTFNQIKQNHIDIAEALTAGSSVELNDFFTEIEWLLHDKPVRSYDYYYDQVVCVGELLSTKIVSLYLDSVALPNTWMDVRDIMRTDNNFRDAKIDWPYTSQKVAENFHPAFNNGDLIITQGFIGATDENESTTLGREGSDYSGAVFANLLNAKSQTIWKDVEGVMNADPKQYPGSVWIEELDYREVIEMAYYGAQVIHPKTIKPLENKNIPLLVKSFVNPTLPGTIIHHAATRPLPPIIVYKSNQCLLTLSSRSFDFVGEGLTQEVFKSFETLKFKPNLTQNGAISLLLVVDDIAEKVNELALQNSQPFNVQVQKDLILLTIRHYNEQILGELTAGKKMLLRQQTQETVQILMEK